MKRKIEVGDAIEYIFEGMPILASVGLIDESKQEYGVYVTSKYSFRKADIAQDYVNFSDVTAYYKKVVVDNKIDSRTMRVINGTKTLTDMRNLC